MRLGAISYCNPRPVDGSLLKDPLPSGVCIEKAVPSVLNQKMLSGDLDVSSVSLMHFAEHSDRYVLLPDVVIATDRAVQSVLLIHSVPLNEIQNIEFTGEGRTTPGLCELLFILSGYKKPSFYKNISDSIKCEARLLIGDEALKFFAKYQQNDKFKMTDLAELWNQLTGRSAVFAVWAARKDYVKQHASKVQEIQRLLFQSRQWGATHLDQIIKESAEELNLPESVMEAYFVNLRYDFTKDLMESAEFFADQAFKHNLLDKQPTFNTLNMQEQKIGDVR